jgi:hypothetical protein
VRNRGGLFPDFNLFEVSTEQNTDADLFLKRAKTFHQRKEKGIFWAKSD